MSLQGFYTERGLALAGKLAAGTKLSVTRVTAGSGETAESAAALSQEKQTLTVGAAAAEGNQATLHATLAEAGASEDYSLTELGVYANDPDAGEILYQVFTLEEGRNVRAGGESVYRFYLRETVGEDGIEVLCAPAGLVTEAELSAAVAKKPDAVGEYTTLHVAKTGSDVTGDGSAAKPYLTIQKAIDSLPKLLMAAAVIQVSAGYYAEKVKLWGFVGCEIDLMAESGAAVSVDSIETGGCVNRAVEVNGFTLVGAVSDTATYPGCSVFAADALCLRLYNLTCTGAEATQNVGALYLCDCPKVTLRSCTISNKKIALDVLGSTVYLNQTVAGTGNTVGIRCGSAWGSKGGYVQKGGASIAGEEQKGYGGQIW